ncbi:MAG TPA: hypothetical protein DCL44_03305 [Elusimicrobia bacterium]|nr:hypothetical protein [Elusimicrobiota bacterium]
MKRIIAIAALVIFGCVSVKASGYPYDYTFQNARVVSVGPAIVVKVESGMMSTLVIGYKRSGMLGGSDSISAVVRTTYSNYNGNVNTVERVIQIPKEWHGTGYMTPEMSPYDFVAGGDSCREIIRIELAFFNGPKWDSNYGANYAVEKNDFYQKAATFRSEHGGGPNIDLYCWDFIVGQMRK